MKNYLFVEENSNRAVAMVDESAANLLFGGVLSKYNLLVVASSSNVCFRTKKGNIHTISFITKKGESSYPSGEYFMIESHPLRMTIEEAYDLIK